MSARVRLPLAIAAAASVCFGAGCEQVDRAEQGARARIRAVTDSTALAIERGASTVARKVATVATEKLATAADTLGAKVEIVARDAGRELAGAIEAADVKTALAADRALEGARIDVAIDARGKTLILRGTVPADSLRGRAERIARARAGEYAVRNELAALPR